MKRYGKLTGTSKNLSKAVYKYTSEIIHHSYFDRCFRLSNIKLNIKIFYIANAYSTTYLVRLEKEPEILFYFALCAAYL